MVSHKVGCLVFWLDYLAVTVVILVADVKQLSDNNCNRTPNFLSVLLVRISRGRYSMADTRSNSRDSEALLQADRTPPLQAFINFSNPYPATIREVCEK